ncbi:MAG: DUF177 domain-containing protein [Candidatus Izimaplasma sp.]|nr:DUF177 domain-containing protein [Candidatus Izimaplasma bacterium]
MKWTIHELRKLQNINNEFKGTVDLSSYIENTDIIKISPVLVEGSFEIYDDSLYEFYFDIKCTLTLECAITLVEVPYLIDISVEEIFSTNKSDENIDIEGITIDLLPIIWSNIILEKPMRITSKNAYDNFESETPDLEEKESINQAFANLKNYKK